LTPPWEALMTNKEVCRELEEEVTNGASHLCLTKRESRLFVVMDLPGWVLSIQTYQGYTRQYHWSRR